VFSRRQFLSLVCTVVAAAALPDSALAGSSDDGGGSDGNTKTEHTRNNDNNDNDDNKGGDSDDGESGSDDDREDEGESGSSNQGSSNQTSKSGSSKGVSTTQDEARAAVKSGKAASLPLVLAFMSINFPGEVLDVKLLQNQKGYVYEVKYLAKSTLLQVVTLDAKTLKTL
jgi:uncharacterized membrane protein YkoI